jgi:choline kinase
VRRHIEPSLRKGARKGARKEAKTLFNPFFQVSGILGSFWAARSFLEGENFLFTTTDHFFHPSVLRGCLCRHSNHLCDIRIVIQKKSRYTREDAKVVIRKSEILKLGKDLPLRQADGEFGGMAYFSSRASRLFFRLLQIQLEKEGLEGYVMDILNRMKEQYPICFSTCGEGERIEIDSVYDLIEARKMAKKWGQKMEKSDEI